MAVQKERLAYVGSYTPEGSGITLWRVHGSTGAMTQLNVFETSNPSWMALDRGRRFLYAVNENEPEGAVSSFALDAASGNLTQINSVSTGGSSPCHLSVHPSGKYVLIANYGSGTVAVVAIRSDGGLGDVTDLQGNPGPLNPARAKDSPAGQTVPSDHGGPHIHMVQTDPAGHFVVASDAGRDQILRWSLDVDSGKLSSAPSPALAVEPGSAPRHFAFHPNGRRLYSLQEQDGFVSVYAYNQTTAALTWMQSLSVFEIGFAGSFACSEIAVSADGRFLYAATRVHDTIATFAIDERGLLTRIGEVWTGTDCPRSFVIDADRHMLFACNQIGNAITTFLINTRTGLLNRTGNYVPVMSPACMLLLT